MRNNYNTIIYSVPFLRSKMLRIRTEIKKKLKSNQIRIM